MMKSSANSFNSKSHRIFKWITHKTHSKIVTVCSYGIQGGVKAFQNACSNIIIKECGGQSFQDPFAHLSIVPNMFSPQVQKKKNKDSRRPEPSLTYVFSSSNMSRNQPKSSDRICATNSAHQDIHIPLLNNSPLTICTYF